MWFTKMPITFVKVKKRIINAQTLVAVISLSLAGIIGLQAYLFRSALMVRDARFKAEAAETLELVSKRLEALEAQRFLSAQLQNTTWQNTVTNTDSVFLINNSVVVSEIDSAFESPLELNLRQFEVRLDTNGLPNEITEQLQIRIAQEKNKYKQHVQERMKRMNMLLRQMMSQGMGGIMPIEAKFSKNEIDSILQSELDQKGLKLTYEFGVVEDGFLTNVKSDAFEAENADFKVPLYKNDFFSGPKWLLISFPKKISYLMKSLWYMLALSALFTTMIIVAFGYTVNQMQKQKNISQIKSDFINNMTHEFKTPIATINLAVDALNNPKVKTDEARIEHYRKIIRQENKRMHSQVEKVLQLAMLDKQELELRNDALNMHDLVEDSANHIALQVEEKGGKVIFDCQAENTIVFGDEVHLGNVIVNLLDNALKYSSDVPELKISSKNIENQLVISISDNGIGMTKEVQRKVFDRFYRQEGGNIHNVKGHGLGLSYVYEIIKMHKGTIVVDSAPGVGSTFTISLPTNNQNNE